MLYSFKEWLTEQVYYNKSLNPNIWDNFKMDEQIRQKLLSIANDFWDFLKLDIQLMDIQLTGSIANYNWTSESDLDVHLIIDFTKINEDIDLVRKAMDGQRFIWNQRHPVILRGHDVECYVQDKNEQHISSGLFSILENKWIVKPSWNPPIVDPLDISDKVRVLIYEFNEIKKEIVSAEGEKAMFLHDYLNKFKKKIMKDRKLGLAKDGENSIENLVFKELRRKGIIEEIINMETVAYLNAYNESKR